MVYVGLLVLSNLKHIAAALRIAEKYVSELYVHINITGRARTQAPPAWGQMICQLYLASNNNTNGCMSPINMRVLVGPLKQQKISCLQLRPVKYIFCDNAQSEVCEELRKDLNILQDTIYLKDTEATDVVDYAVSADCAAQENELETYNTVVLGGTFDRLHLGHKIFLTEAVLRARKRLVVGVTVNEMNKSKTLYELILPVAQRIAEVQQFLREIDTTLEYDVVPIEDAFGPTRTDPDMDMIVVSAETLRGGQKVNELRAQNQLQALKIYVVNLVQDNSCSSGPREAKISSSNQRLDILGTRLRKPDPRTNLPKRPYIVGLTGGIGSGKSLMAERFEKRGAAVFNCDLIAHSTYEPGENAYLAIVKHFGKGILDDKERIDRKKLGAIVFSDFQQLQVLNSIVWPETMLAVRQRIQEAYKERQLQVAIVEAALLFNAGWEKECHEVWAMLVPPEEAVQRIMRRNNLSEEEARKRVASQLPNTVLVEKAQVVFSSQWDSAFTDAQAERAWQLLMAEL